jgi:signal transduction histidine kinase
MDDTTPNPMAAEHLLRELDHLQLAVNDLHREVEEQAAMASMGVLAASIAHEVSNRLTPMAAYAQMALAAPADVDLGRKALEMAVSCSKGLADLAGIILSLTKPAIPGDSAKADVTMAWSRVEDLVRQAAKDRRVAIRREVDEGLEVAMPQAALEHVLLNLALNAIGAMPKGGLLSIEASKCSTWNSGGEEVLIAVMDTGHGMDAAAMRRATEPGFSTGAGHGLGLTICERLVRSSGGTLQLQSRPDFGTRAQVSLQCYS